VHVRIYEVAEQRIQRNALRLARNAKAAARRDPGLAELVGAAYLVRCSPPTRYPMPMPHANFAQMVQ